MGKAFQSWKDEEDHRRLYVIQLLVDVLGDYVPVKQVRSIPKQNVSRIGSKTINQKSKRP